MIAIDANEANVENPVGSNVFVQEIIRHLAQNWFDKDPKIEILLSRPPQTNFFRNLNWPVEVIQPSFLWTQWRLPFYLFRHRPKIIFTPGHYGPRFKPQKTKSAITIFDLAYIHFPNYFLKKDFWQLSHWTKYSVAQADLIFTISQNSRKDISRIYKIDPAKIIITYPGHRFQNIQPDLINYHRLQRKYNFQNKKYFLFVGTLQPRKNIVNLIKAFMNLKTDYKLIIIGKKGWLFNQEIKNWFNKGQSSKRVIWLDFVADSTLAAFYAQAYFLILPSLWEGFGLPVVEAGFFQTPAIVADNSSLKELVVDPDLRIPPPFSSRQIIKVLSRMLKLKGENYEKISYQAKQKAELFSWDQTAAKIKNQLLNLYYS